ncbi:MAG: alpha/beta hydrolase [Micropruina sp.]
MFIRLVAQPRPRIGGRNCLCLRGSPARTLETFQGCCPPDGRTTWRRTSSTSPSATPTCAWDIAADIYFPPGFDEAKSYPAIVCAHPIGSCKDQASGNIYATVLAEAGNVAIAFSGSFQGASGGAPRFMEDPAQRTEGSRRVVDHLVNCPMWMPTGSASSASAEAANGCVLFEAVMAAVSVRW